MKCDKQTIAWTSGIIALTAGFLFLVTGSQLKQTRGLIAQINSERSQLAVTRHNLQSVAALQQEVNQLAAETADFDAQIPVEEMQGAFVTELARLAQRHNLKPSEIKPGEVIRSAEVSALPITFKVRGPFPAVHKLLQDLEAMPRITQIQQFKSEADEENPDQVLTEVSLRIFFRAS